MHFGREDIEHIFHDAEAPIVEGMFDQIKPCKESANNVVTQEHFIIRRISDGNYTIEDRNSPAMTYLNNQLIGKSPVPLKAGDVITLPLVKNKSLQAFYIQVKFIDAPINGAEMKQLHQCARTGDRFFVIWVEDEETRKHFAIRTEKLKNPEPVRSTETSFSMGSHSLFLLIILLC